MWKVLSSALNTCHRRRSSWIKYSFQGKRFFLSEAYRCQQEWTSRLQAPILQNIKLDEMFYELDHKFQNEGKASVIDVDLFANAINNDSHVEELEDIMHKLRISPNTAKMLPSTPHAFIRLLLALEKDKQLLQILNDRLNYGIFPDDYCTNLLMDTFIKNENYTAAAQVGVLQMLQEDWSNPITAHLALYSCHMYLKNPGEWVLDDEDSPSTESAEEVKVRVKFLRNAFFDDHFDLREPKLLVGKTLATLGYTMPDIVGNTYHIIGLALYNKWDQCISLLRDLQTQKRPIFNEAVKTIDEELEKQTTEGNEFQIIKDTISLLLKELASSNLVSDGDLDASLLEKVQRVVKGQEAEVITAQRLVYQEWEKDRMAALQEQMEALKTQQRLAKVREEKEKMALKEQELFFFDNEDKWDLVIDSKRVFYPKRYFGKLKKKRVKDENYVPPEI